jgi:DNA-binding MarR family transcriptional regulator
MNDTTAAAQVNTLAKVLTALAALGEGTPKGIAELAGIGYSTTTPKLRALQDAGHAERFSDGQGRILWRLTAAGRTEAETHTSPTGDPDTAPTPHHDNPDDAGQTTDGPPAAVPPPSDTTTAADLGDEPLDEPDAPDTAPDQQTTTLDAHDAVAQPAPQPAAASDEPDGAPRNVTAAAEQGTDQPDDTDPPDPAADATTTRPVDTQPDTGVPPGGQGPQPRADVDTSDRGDTANADADAVTGAAPSAAPAQGVAPLGGQADPAATDEPATPRRTSGSLRGAILDILHEHPGQQYKTGELCKLIDRANAGTNTARASAGAVHNAVVKLVGDGHAVQTVEKPATFALAPTTG